MNIMVFRTKRKRVGTVGKYEYFGQEDMTVALVNASISDIVSSEAGRIRDQVQHKLIEDGAHAVGMVRISISVGADDDRK